MPLTQKTLEEMEAGALALAHQRGEAHLPEGYMERMIRTQERSRLLRVWEDQGKIRVEMVSRMKQPIERLDNGTATMVHYKVIHVGNEKFEDREAEAHGAFPSEVLIANIALALGAGRHKAEM